MTGALAVLPSFLRSGGRHSATQVGWLLMIDAGSTTVFIVFCIKWCLHRYKNRNTLIWGALLLSGGMCALSILLTSAYADWIFIAPFLIRGGVIGLFVPALDYGTQIRINRSAIPFSSTTHYLLRALGQSIGTTLVARIVDVRMTLHASRLGEHVSAFDASSQVYSHSAQSIFARVGLAVGPAAQATVRDMALALRQQALVLADADCLLVMGIIGLLFAVIAYVFFDRDVDPLHIAALHPQQQGQSNTSNQGNTDHGTESTNSKPFAMSSGAVFLIESSDIAVPSRVGIAPRTAEARRKAILYKTLISSLVNVAGRIRSAPKGITARTNGCSENHARFNRNERRAGRAALRTI
jgi:hypothetical protein